MRTRTPQHRFGQEVLPRPLFFTNSLLPPEPYDPVAAPNIYQSRTHSFPHQQPLPTPFSHPAFCNLLTAPPPTHTFFLPSKFTQPLECEDCLSRQAAVTEPPNRTAEPPYHDNLMNLLQSETNQSHCYNHSEPHLTNTNLALCPDIQNIALDIESNKSSINTKDKKRAS